MRSGKLSIAAVLLGVLSSSVVWAQEASQPLQETEAIRQVACEDDCGSTCQSNTSCDCDSGLFGECSSGDPWKLPQPSFLQRLGINTGGWLQAGITVNGENPGDNFNGPVLTNDRHAELQMNQSWLYFERPCDTSGDGFDLGGRLDLLYGTEWRVAYAFGFGMEDRLNGTDRLYGFSLPQMYAEMALGKLSVKAGRMMGIPGHEMVPPMGNFFYSHSYAICYSEPLLITGVMAKYPLADQWTVQAGFHQGYRRFENNNDKLNFQGGLSWTSRDGQTSLAYSLDTGKIDDAGSRNQSVQILGLKHQLSEKTLYVIQGDLGFLDGVGGSSGAEWYGISQYLSYTLNERWSMGARLEWFRDDDGAVVFGVGNLPDARGWLGAPGYAGHFTDFTVGLNWRPRANVTLRPEVRWDWYDGPANAAGPAPLPFGNGLSKSQFTLAADLVVTF